MIVYDDQNGSRLSMFSWTAPSQSRPFRARLVTIPSLWYDKNCFQNMNKLLRLHPFVYLKWWLATLTALLGVGLCNSINLVVHVDRPHQQIHWAISNYGFLLDSLYEKKIGEDLVFNNSFSKSLTLTQIARLMHPSKETLNSPSSRVDADSTSRRRRILSCIFSGVGESWPN